ncbi:MAG: hypothetical protein ABIJ00_13665 [Candidatus Eisenbacteria bacterium]
MSHRYSAIMQLVLVAITLAAILLSGCGAKKFVVAEKPKGITLEYRMPEGEVFKYKSTQNADQTMEMMGMSMETTAHKFYEFTCAPQGGEGNNYELRVTIDAMEAGMETPQGDYAADTDSVLGKSFTLLVSNLGKELDVSDAEPITYDAGPMGPRSIRPDFQIVFPDLPTTPVEIGAMWTTQDTLEVSEGDIDILVTMTRVHTLTGIEPMMGMESAVVTTEVTGVVSGVGKQGEADIKVEGTMTGTETWYFAHEQGLFVEWSSEMFSKNMIDIKGPQEMSFPMSEKMSFKTVLVQ